MNNRRNRIYCQFTPIRRLWRNRSGGAGRSFSIPAIPRTDIAASEFLRALGFGPLFVFGVLDLQIVKKTYDQVLELPHAIESFCGTWFTAKPLILGRRSPRWRYWPIAYALGLVL